MKNQRDKLHQYQKRITVITSREKDIAKECLRDGNKQKALLALRRKKYQESLLAKTDQQLAQLEALTSDVEFALVQKDVVFGLQQGTAVLKEIHKEMGGLEKGELIMGESEEAQAYQKVRYTTNNVWLIQARLLTICRKLARCLVEECPIKTKTRSKRSLKLWKEKQLECRVYLMRHLVYRKTCQPHPKRHPRSERNEGGRKEPQLSSKMLSQLLRDEFHEIAWRFGECIWLAIVF